MLVLGDWIHWNGNGQLWGILSADPHAVAGLYIEDFTDDYTKDQIYTAEEIGPNFKTLPQMSPVSKEEHKMNKQIITGLA